tara:strand:+ start:2076 stop:2546 length:471 start_codon:yes stop_codon:yes gene_type:complete
MKENEKSSPLTTAMNMWVHYKGVCYHYALILPPEIYMQSCRARLAKAFGWENPTGVSSWEFILPKVLDEDIKVHLMQAITGAYIHGKGYLDKELYADRKQDRDMLLKDIADESKRQFVRRHLDRFAHYLGTPERESRYDSTKWENYLKRLHIVEKF